MSLSAFVVPVLLDTNPDADHIVRQWSRLYHYGHIYLPALCVSTCGVYLYGAFNKRTAKSPQWSRYAAAAVATITMVPFTWLVMVPTNNTLFGLEESGSGSGSGSRADRGFVRELVIKWAWMHVARSLTPLVGAFLGFTGLLRELRAY